ncbi:MAG: hypothetical protein K8R99_07115 [Actinomycetia bacterium]|nr:hypothetical protein [Actinomycetes bacterium]
MTQNLVHFLLVYDHKTQSLKSQEQFDDSDAAVAAYFAMEQAHKDDSLIEIVLIGSDSVETIRITHANYFDGTLAISEYLTGI